MKFNILGKPKIRGYKPYEMLRNFLDDMASQMDAKQKLARKWARKEIKEYIIRKIKESPTAIDLQDTHKLAALVGIPKGDGLITIDKIAETIKTSALISFRKIRRAGKRIVGGLVIGIIIDDYSDVLDLDVATITAENKEKKTVHLLPWLKWLIIDGSQIITDAIGPKPIRDYGPVYKRSKRSRSGEAVMIKTGRGFRIPPQHSGTENDNWLIRSFEADLVTFLESILARMFK